MKGVVFIEMTIGSMELMLGSYSVFSLGRLRSRIDVDGIGGISSTDGRGEPVCADVAYVVTLKRDGGWTQGSSLVASSRAVVDGLLGGSCTE
jgi:hypothetical protein